MTTSEAIQFVYDRIFNSSLKTTITGSIYKIRRPLNSNKEDIVIGALAINNSALQQCVINVNVHVPTIKITKGDVTDDKFPNTDRIKTLSIATAAVLKDNWVTDANFDVQNENVIQDETGYYINFRINFFNINF